MNKTTFIDLARYIKKDLVKYATEKHNITLTVRYLNPTYAIRTATANGQDTNLCHRLGHSAVHSMQAGYTDFSIGLVRSQSVMIPIKLLNNLCQT